MPTTTEIAVAGANCSTCFNETLDALRRQPGVRSVSASITGQCVRVEHDEADVEDLVAVIRRHLHADVLAAAEHVMDAVEPRITVAACPHDHPAATRSR